MGTRGTKSYVGKSWKVHDIKEVSRSAGNEEVIILRPTSPALSFTQALPRSQAVQS